ncbi:MAG TPA: hypothetical protein VMC03_01425 [Streptosporangiaceae bacterium]|nr:hypothetical protein [Streptosporangiaceae bacterium]
MSTVTIRNAITDARQVLEIQPDQTVRQAVEKSGFIAAGNPFAVRDKVGNVVDDEQVADHKDTVLTVGLPDDQIEGGKDSRPQTLG